MSLMMKMISNVAINAIYLMLVQILAVLSKQVSVKNPNGSIGANYLIGETLKVRWRNW